MKKRVGIALAVGCLALSVAGILLGVIIVKNAGGDDFNDSPQCVVDRICYVGQDWIRYREYQYLRAPEQDSGLRPITEQDVEEIRTFVDHYQALIGGMKDSTDQQRRALYEGYGFDLNCLSDDDYFSLEEERDNGVLGRSGLWLFDSGTLVLYGMEVKY